MLYVKSKDEIVCVIDSVDKYINYKFDVVILDEGVEYLTHTSKTVFNLNTDRYLLLYPELVDVDKKALIDLGFNISFQMSRDEAESKELVKKGNIYDVHIQLEDSVEEKISKLRDRMMLLMEELPIPYYKVLMMIPQLTRTPNAVYISKALEIRKIVNEINNIYATYYKKYAFYQEIILNTEKPRCIVFANSVEQSMYIESLFPLFSKSYHSKLKKKEQQSIIEEFSINKFQSLVSVNALKRGLDVQDVNLAFEFNRIGTKNAQYAITQEIGRCRDYFNFYRLVCVAKTFKTSDFNKLQKTKVKTQTIIYA
jgi:superfamily II DNA or RNA helicase